MRRVRWNGGVKLKWGYIRCMIVPAGLAGNEIRLEQAGVLHDGSLVRRRALEVSYWWEAW